MTATEQRDLAVQLSRTDPDHALAVARQIKDPWYACQALAWIARYYPGPGFEGIIDESFLAGSESEDPYRVVASAAWPVRARVECGHAGMLSSIIPGLLKQQIERRMADSETATPRPFFW